MSLILAYFVAIMEVLQELKEVDEDDRSNTPVISEKLSATPGNQPSWMFVPNVVAQPLSVKMVVIPAYPIWRLWKCIFEGS